MKNILINQLAHIEEKATQIATQIDWNPLNDFFEELLKDGLLGFVKNIGTMLALVGAAVCVVILVVLGIQFAYMKINKHSDGLHDKLVAMGWVAFFAVFLGSFGTWGLLS